MLVRLWNRLLAPSDDPAKSGKREIALTMLFFAGGLTVWRLPHLSEASQTEVVSWWVTLSFFTVLLAYGMDAAARQMGLTWFGQSGSMPFRQSKPADRDIPEGLE